MDDFRNNNNKLIFVVVSCVFFEARTELLNNIYTNFGFKGLVKTDIRIFLLMCELRSCLVTRMQDRIVI
jgi:hypothetical protein